MEFNIEPCEYHIYRNGKLKAKTKNWKKANFIFNEICHDLFDRFHVEIINAETGEIMRERR